MMLADYAKNIGIIFTASVFDEESAGLLEMIGSPIYKIASSDLTYLQLLNYVARKNKPIILSTGMSTIKEIKEALSEIYKVGNRQVALLHCVSSYPATYEEMNLKAISTLKQAFNVPVGLSDHTKGNIVPIVAVTIGANIIEKHFTLNKNLPGPDHKFSLEPHDFKEMVRSIRIIERALGDGDKKPTKDERDIRRLARRSITAKVSIPKGTIIAKEMIKIVRPGNGIEPKYLEFVIGKKSKEDIAKDETIKWGAL
jgi:N-acetylneuraminate synthase/N,N'-diacetyllegionaminate synthase